MPEDDYYDSMETNPFRLSNDFDIYKARADDQREKAEQAALLKKVPIHLRTNEYASRNRNLGLTDPKSKGSVSSSRHSSTTTSNVSGRGSRAQAGKSSTSLPPIAKARNQRVAREEELQIPKEVFNRLDAYSPLYSEKYAHLTKKDREFLENLVRDPGPRPKLDEYMGKQRDIFLAELSLQTKKSEINNINNQIRAKEDSLKAEVKKLDVEVSKFDKFIRHSDLGTVKTISESEKAVKARTQRQEMIRNTSSQIIALKSEITKYELSIRQLHRYRLFLDQLISVKDRELLVGRRERYTVQRMAIAFCLEKYGHCHGLCLTCFCFPLNPTIVQTGAITPYNLLVMDDTCVQGGKAYYDKILTESTEVLASTIDTNDRIDPSKNLDEMPGDVIMKKLCDILEFYTIINGRCSEPCTNYCNYMTISSQEDKQYIMRMAPNVFAESGPVIQESQIGAGTISTDGSVLMKSNLKQLGLTMRHLARATQISIEEYSHIPVSEPGLSDYYSTNVGLFVNEENKIPFLDTNEFVESLRSIENTNFFLLEHLQTVETSQEAFIDRCINEYREREEEMRQLLMQTGNLQTLAQRTDAEEVEGEASYVEATLDYNTHLVSLLEDAIRQAYIHCTKTSDSDALSVTPLNMLSKIERLLQHSSALVKKLPEKYHILFEKAREKERRKERHRKRQEELALIHADKIARARERALEPIKKATIRKVMARSYGTTKKAIDKSNREQDEDRGQLQLITSNKNSIDFGKDFYE